MIIWLRQNKYLIAITLFCIAYVIYLLQFYISSHYVPDFSAYYEFGIRSLIKYGAFVSHDGFSTLFLQIASWSAYIPQLLHLSSLLLQTFGIFSVLYWLPKIIDLKESTKFLSAFFLISCGFIFYFYGKLFYDFPFTFGSFGLVIFLFWRFSQAAPTLKNIWFILFCLSLGFCLSWKPYNIFLIGGFLGLLLSNSHTKDSLLTVLPYSYLKKLLKSLQYGAFVLFGYLLGNYSFFQFPQETLNGLRAYPAHSNPLTFFYRSNNWIIWDHVNSLAFNDSSMLILSMILILFIAILLRKWRYLVLYLFSIICFLLFLYFFSPGYPWHGFPFALYLFLYFVFILKEIDYSQIGKIKRRLILAVIIVLLTCQFMYNFFFYIPKQSLWHKYTQESIKILTKNKEDILQSVRNFAEHFEASVIIDSPIKRYIPIRHNTYLSVRSDPLADKIVNNDTGYISDYILFANKNSSNFLAYVIPDTFFKLNDIAEIPFADHKPFSILKGDGFKIILLNLYDTETF